MLKNQIRGLVLAEELSLETCQVIDSLLEASLPVTFVWTGDTPPRRLSTQVNVIQAEWNNDFSEALNLGLDSVEPGAWVLRIDTDEHQPPDLSGRLAEAVAHAEERNTDAFVVPVVEWLENSYLPICPIRLWKHTAQRKYRGVASEVIYDCLSGMPLHRAFYPLAPAGFVLKHSPNGAREWQRPLRREWMKKDPESVKRALVLDLTDQVVNQKPFWRQNLKTFFSGTPSSITSRMLHGGSLSLMLLVDHVFTSSQEFLMRDSSIRLVESCLGLFGWSPLVLFCALRVLVVSDYEGPWRDAAILLHAECNRLRPIFHSLDSADILAALDQLLEVINKDAEDLRMLGFRQSIRMSEVMPRYLNRWDRLVPGRLE